MSKRLVKIALILLAPFTWSAEPHDPWKVRNGNTTIGRTGSTGTHNGGVSSITVDPTPEYLDRARNSKPPHRVSVDYYEYCISGPTFILVDENTIAKPGCRIIKSQIVDYTSQY